MEKFWDFSFTEMAKFDLPATIEEIHCKTRQKISIIGYSEGGLVRDRLKLIKLNKLTKTISLLFKKTEEKWLTV